MKRSSAGWNKKNRDKCRVAEARYRAAHPDKVKSVTKKWRKKNPERVLAQRRNQNRKSRDARFNPTRPEPESCECCGLQDTRALCLDHCHKTGEFRGWLCSRCNRAIGLIGDSTEALTKALNYLTNGREAKVKP
jgi:hypothetical protein